MRNVTISTKLDKCLPSSDLWQYGIDSHYLYELQQQCQADHHVSQVLVCCKEGKQALEHFSDMLMNNYGVHKICGLCYKKKINCKTAVEKLWLYYHL